MEVKFEVNEVDGNLTFNLFEVLEKLSDEQKQELLWDGGWWSLIDEELAKKIIKEFSAENYNSIYTKLRSILLTSENMPEVIRQWAFSMIDEKLRAQEQERYWRDAYWALYHWTNRDWNGTGEREKPNLPSHVYGKRYSSDLLREIEDQIQEWGKLFPDIKLPELEK